MNADAMKRCPHYQIYSEQLKMEGPPAFLAIRRCMLTERLLQFLDQSEEGRQLGEKMVIHTRDGKRYAFVGTDLEPVTQQACHSRRCEERCTPAYLQTLQRFEMVDPQEEEVTCDDSDEQEATDPASRIPTALPS
ncbi:MAG: hypothetical protein JWL77_4728 [Chthonomonadaceae bacterium]|nr:hypothetical protein [Chthonomonadaceae bacterium]